jgi:hypothetical protein
MTRVHQSRAIRDRAALALEYAIEALSEGEDFECSEDELLGLCDEVVRRRLLLDVAELALGAMPSAAVLAQMTRDRLLVDQSAETVTLHVSLNAHPRVTRIPRPRAS